MISTEVSLVHIDSIPVDWSARRNIDEEHVALLADSIARNDLIHTIVLDESGGLCAGAHRLRAWFLNRETQRPCPKASYEAWNYIPARIAQDFSEADLARIELIENLQQNRLDWKDEADGILKVDRLQREAQKGWTQAQTAELINMAESAVSRAIVVANELPSADEALLKCESIWSAYKIIQRRSERKKASIMESIFSGKKSPTVSIGRLLGTEPEEELKEEEEKIEPSSLPSSPILNASFEEFARDYSGPRFNFLHCDFPYGLNISTHYGQGTRKDAFNYDDSEELYWSLLETLAEHQNKLLAESCHVMFWFSQNYLTQTIEFFEKHLPRLKRQSHLMIWHFIDKSGIVPDTQRYGRRNYETAMCFVGGDRKIVRITELCQGYSGQAGRAQALHRSEKPYSMLKAFLSMFIDENSVVLDPTCGSGTALRVAHSLGAKEIVGVEKDADMAKAAGEAFIKHVQVGEVNVGT